MNFLQAISNSHLAVAWPNKQLEASQSSGIIKRQHQQHCRHSLPSEKASHLATVSGHVASTQSELLRTIQPEAAAPAASVSAAQPTAEQYLLHNQQSAPLSTMDVLPLLFQKEQSPAAAALLPTALRIQHSGAAVTQPPATAAAPTAKTAAPTAAPTASARTAKTTDDSAAADHLAPAATSVLAPILNAEPTAAAGAAAADAERGAATAAATDTGGAVAPLAATVPVSTAAILFATTAPAAMAATAAKAADGTNDSTADASTGTTLSLLVLILPFELSCCLAFKQ